MKKRALTLLTALLVLEPSAALLRDRTGASIEATLLGPGKAEAADGLAVLDLKPERISDEKVQQELKRVSRRIGSVSLVKPTRLLLQTLQWAVPDPQRSSCYDGDEKPRSRKKPTPEGRNRNNVPQEDLLFASLLEKARVQGLAGDNDLALESLKNARSVLACSETIIPREQLRALFLQEGVARFFMKDSDFEEVFFNVLAVDPNTHFDAGGYPSTVRKAFEKVEKKNEKRRTISLVNDLSDVKVFVDGAALEQSMTIFPGRHLIQVRGPAGRLRSQLVGIPEASEVPLTEVMDLGLFPTEQVRDVLARDIRANNPDRYTREGLEDYIREAGLSALIFAVEPTSDNKSYLRVYVAGTGMMSIQDYLRNSYKVVNRSAARGLRSRDPVAGAGLTFQGILGAPSAFVENGRLLGVTLWYEQPLGELQVGGRLGFLPYTLRPISDASSCGTDSGCNGAASAVSLGVHLGNPIYLTEQLRITPGLTLETALLPELIIAESAPTPQQSRLLSVWAGGSQARLEVTYNIPFESLKLEFGAELTGGVWAAPDNGAALLLFPVASTLRAGLVF